MQEAKKLIREYYESFDQCSPSNIKNVMDQYCDPGFTWRGCHPFYEFDSVEKLCDEFWKPLRQSVRRLQRRQDIFMAGINSITDDESVWVCSMGNLMGLFDLPWLSIPPTGKMIFMRYCEFHQVRSGKIVHTAMWFDIPQLMDQAGVNPFPPQTGANQVQPGPMTHEGMMFGEQDPQVGEKTLETMMKMVNCLGNWDNKLTLEEELALTWHDDMIWWGPTGIGSSYTIERYAKQHSGPFRKTFKDRIFHGHVCRFAEGNFGGWFGWPNLTLTPVGGFNGMPSSDKPCDMRVIDIYRRDGEKLSENWVFIDMLHFWNQQGLDVLGRLKSINPQFD